jgi:uncharacterized membrane protein
MVLAAWTFVAAAIVGHGGYVDREVTGPGLALTLLGFLVLTLGGWLGGTVVFVHGMRVLGDEERPASEAAAPDAGEARRAREAAS